MSNLPASLASHVPWLQLATTLEIENQDRALPATAYCPVCRKGLMRVYHDSLGEGDWYRCDTCDDHGDMIELAARAWQLDI